MESTISRLDDEGETGAWFMYNRDKVAVSKTERLCENLFTGL